MRRYILSLVLCGLLSGCAGGGNNAGIQAIALKAGLVRTQIRTDVFLLTAYSKMTAPSQPIDIYIEGDGLAWLTENQPSPNPTPHKALGLRLAARDPAQNVIYIARPCQFTPLEADRNCAETYWTDRRFSEEVIQSIDQAIDQFTALYSHPRLNLIGYSGGGAVAVLVAARRSDVTTVRTVAGNLDHEMVNRLNEVSPLDGSLNAIDKAWKIENIPQRHFSGSEDDIIPPLIASRFIDAMSAKNCAHSEIVDGVSHENGWEDRWMELLRHPVDCAP